MRPAIIPLSQAHRQPLSRVGGKAWSLGRLIAAGAPVPPGFVVPPGAELSDDLWRAFDQLGAEHVAVRSSAAGEDADAQSWAGQFESYLQVPRARLVDSITACRRSGGSVRAQAYDAAAAAMPVAVVVQVMVPANAAGVLFTVNPVTRVPHEVVIEAVYGLGEQLVQGLAIPDQYVHHKTGRHVLRETVAVKLVQLAGTPAGVVELPVPDDHQSRPVLSRGQREHLVGLAVQLEQVFGHPLDIEFAMAGPLLFIVQARPITTL
jgi:phosphoenolpyruvate synthase/pyruvate phosphate dikinase